MARKRTWNQVDVRDFSGGQTAGVKILFQPRFIILLLCLKICGSSGSLCGYPGRPYRGSLSLYSSSFYYNPGQRSNYACNKGFTLLGDATRICQDEGHWSGQTPMCVINMALGKTVDTSPTIQPYLDTSINDGNTDTCAYMDMSTSVRYVRVDLGQNYMVDAIVIHVPQGLTQEVSVFVAEKLTHTPGIQYRSCTQSIEEVHHQRLLIECKSDKGKTGLYGQYIYVRDDRKEPAFYFSICEIEILTREEKYLCGSPDAPAFGSWHRVSENLVEYSCNPGFVLKGSKESSCEGGVWTGTTPQCLAVECSPLSIIDNGFIDIFPLRGLTNNSFNSVANYGCHAGFALKGNASRVCQTDAKWSGTQPQCLPIDCGPPRRVTNAHYVLPTNSTSVGSAVDYDCLPGHHPQKIVKNKPLVMSTTCTDTGIWKEVNFYCSPSMTSSSKQPDSTRNTSTSTSLGRSIVFDNLNSDPTMVITTREEQESTNSNVVAIIATALVAVLVVVLMFLVGVALNVIRLEPLSNILRSRQKPNPVTENHYQEPFQYSSSNHYASPTPVKSDVIINDPIYCDIGSPASQADYDNEAEERLYSDIQLIPTNDNAGDATGDVIEAVAPPPVVDIQQLYAQVDKTKKKKRKQEQTNGDCRESPRPLPPVPEVNDLEPLDFELDLEPEYGLEDSHIYMTLPNPKV